MQKAILFLLIIFTGFSAVKAQPTPQQDSLKQYTGKYKFPEGSIVTEVTVTLDNNILTANSAMGSSELRKTDGDIFEIVAYAGTATFKRNTEGKISGVRIVVGDTDIEGTKTGDSVSKALFSLFYGTGIENRG